MNSKSYKTLLTKSINIYNSEVKVTEDKILDIMAMCYKNTAFSTFPYFYHNFNSAEAMAHTKSGNCVALSLYVQQKLKEKYGINSCLIPATIPKKYQRKGYLDISHVAVLIPIDNSPEDTGVFIVDPAFYFLNPIEINTKDFNPKVVFSKNIYTPETNDNLIDYISIDKIIVKLKLLTTNYELNKWQMIKKGTYYIDCHEYDDPVDNWKYFLIEILNPDEAITSFFLDEQVPFITTTEGDKNHLPQMGGYLKIKDNKIIYSKNLKDTQTYDINNISAKELNKLNKELFPFFKGNLQQYLK